MKKIILAFFAFFTLANCATAQTISDGMKYIENENWGSACKFFKNYTVNRPNDPDGHYWLGLAYKHLGYDDLSTYHLKKSHQLSQNADDVELLTFKEDLTDEEDYIDMGVMYLETQNFQKAQAYADMVLEMSPNSAKAYYLKSRIYDTTGDYKSAKNALIRAIQADNEILKSELAKKYEITTVPPYDYDYYNSLGLRYYYFGDFERAQKSFEKSLELNFKNPAALNNLAQVYIKSGQFEKAKAQLKKAQLLSPKYYPTYQNLALLAKLQSEQENISKFAEKKYKFEERTNLERGIKINPNDKRAYVALGNYYLDENEPELALENFNKALALDDEYYEAYLGTAAVQIAMNNTDKALLALRSAGALNGESDEIPYYLAKMCIIDNRFDEAKEYLTEAIDKANKTEYILELGKIYYYQNDFESAKNAFLEAQEQDNRFSHGAELYNYLGLSCYKTFDLENAVHNLKKAHEIDPNRVIYTYNLALAYKSADNKDLFNKTMNEVLSFSPKNAVDWADLSSIYYDTNKIEQSIDTINEGIKKFPKERSLYNSKIKLLEALNRPEEVSEVKRIIKTVFN